MIPEALGIIAQDTLNWFERQPGIFDAAIVFLLVAVFCFSDAPWNYGAIALLLSLRIGYALLRAVLVFSFLFIRNQAVMEPRDYVHPPFWPSDLRRAYRAYTQGRADKL